MSIKSGNAMKTQRLFDRFAVCAFSLFCFMNVSMPIAGTAEATELKDYLKKPKLVLILVIDQFRSDYLSKFQSKFVEAGNSKAPGGFNFLMSQGAYFPTAEYDAMQDMTCPGHATIASGSHPGQTGIILNDWYSRKSGKKVYCTDDSEDTVSPRNLKTTTIGDELKGISKNSKVISIALKDRSAVMLGGHRSDGSYWFDTKEWKWLTSSYYKNSNHAWLNEHKVNPKFPKAKETIETKDGVEMTLDLAQFALTKLELGKSKNTDILAVSLSSHDLLGHMLGPDHDDMEKMTLAEDVLISKFLKALAKHLGSLDEVTIAFTADHGVGPTIEQAKQNNFSAGKVDSKAMKDKLTAHLNESFGDSKGQPWIDSFSSGHVFFNEKLVKEMKISTESLYQTAKNFLKSEPGVANVFSSIDFEKSNLPGSIVGDQIRKSYIPDFSGDLVVLTEPFWIPPDIKATHMTGYSYDRSVPVILYGKQFKKGVYAGAKVVDIAPTLAHVLGTLPPLKNEGKVLSQSLK